MLRSLRQPTLTASRAFSTSRCMLQVRKGDIETTGFEEATRSEVVSGAPHDLTQRVVRIFKPSKSATQSGSHGSNVWRIDWDVVHRANRWENEMMGWASSGDYMQGMQMNFLTKEDAIQFAKNQAWDYYVQEPHKREFRPKQYATNFCTRQKRSSFIDQSR